MIYKLTKSFSINGKATSTLINYLHLDREKIVYGVDTFTDEIKNSSLKELLKQPFQGYKKPSEIEEV
ncbi:hypothetical protein BTO04_00550 [Polaribacter sp. SA4-10]|uniref:hypothetical protein n=1 Tax=Polaribacter sp. SA4-10 TaxID=754397 RepID=UPI000B3CE54D|nr:hypothetical protein BTO04_00550 [Polaribacter sp. SA4-10]